MPLRLTMSAANVAEGRSSALSISEVPPKEWAEKRISSCLKSVGLSTTRTPLLNSHSVVPSVSFLVVFLIRPALGAFSTRVVRTASSAGASIARLCIAAKPSRSSASVGRSALSGAVIDTMTFSSVTNCCAMPLIEVMSSIGRSCCRVSYSHAIPGMTSPSKKWRMYSRV